MKQIKKIMAVLFNIVLIFEMFLFSADAHPTLTYPHYHYSRFYNKWEIMETNGYNHSGGTTITYKFDSNLNGNSNAYLRTAFTSAASAWTQAIPELQFESVSGNTVQTFNVGKYFRQYNDYNQIENTLAYVDGSVFSTYVSGETNHKHYGRNSVVMMNTYHMKDIKTQANITANRNIMIHELGHCIGLSDLDDSISGGYGCVMGDLPGLPTEHDIRGAKVVLNLHTLAQHNAAAKTYETFLDEVPIVKVNISAPGDEPDYEDLPAPYYKTEYNAALNHRVVCTDCEGFTVESHTFVNEYNTNNPSNHARRCTKCNYTAPEHLMNFAVDPLYPNVYHTGVCSVNGCGFTTGRIVHDIELMSQVTDINALYHGGECWICEHEVTHNHSYPQPAGGGWRQYCGTCGHDGLRAVYTQPNIDGVYYQGNNITISGDGSDSDLRKNFRIAVSVTDPNGAVTWYTQSNTRYFSQTHNFNKTGTYSFWMGVRDITDADTASVYYYK